MDVTINLTHKRAQDYAHRVALVLAIINEAEKDKDYYTLRIFCEILAAYTKAAKILTGLNLQVYADDDLYYVCFEQVIGFLFVFDYDKETIVLKRQLSAQELTEWALYFEKGE